MVFSLALVKYEISISLKRCEMSLVPSLIHFICAGMVLLISLSALSDMVLRRKHRKPSRFGVYASQVATQK